MAAFGPRSPAGAVRGSGGCGRAAGILRWGVTRLRPPPALARSEGAPEPEMFLSGLQKTQHVTKFSAKGVLYILLLIDTSVVLCFTVQLF